MSSPSVFIYGAGRLGLAVARLASARGMEVRGLWNPRPLEGERKDRASGFQLATGEELPAADADFWLLAVPDDAIMTVAASLAIGTADNGSALPGCAAHSAGGQPAALLAPLAELGVPCGSWHPVMTFRGSAGDSAALAESWVTMEGEENAIERLAAFSDALGVPSIRVAADRKRDYHAALVLASNGRVALDAAARRLLQSAGLEETTARDLLGPLVRRTDQNLTKAAPEAALTGPVARGDVQTVDSQLDALKSHPSVLELYVALARVALELVPPESRSPAHITIEDRLRALGARKGILEKNDR